MYVSHFGLRHAPFSIAPDPRYLYMSERHREALAHLLYGVQAGGGFVLLTGEIGAGKTTVCRCFLEQVPAGCQVAYIVNPKLSVAELLQTVAEEFGIAAPQPSEPAPQPTVKTWVDALNRHLLAAHAQGHHCLLIIDEAQHLSADVLEQLRLLTNLETQERKLLQIILIGQPELRDQLAAPGMQQLAQRVIARYHLQALSPTETGAYVAHRLAVAGLAGANPFDAQALQRVQTLTGGVPRRINLLCDRALLGAYAQGQARVDRRTVDQAAQEVFGPTGRAAASDRRWVWQGLAMAACTVAVVAVLAARPWSAWMGGAQRNAGATQAAPGQADRTAAPTAAMASAAKASTATASTAPSSASTTAPGQAAPVASTPARRVFDPAVDWALLASDESSALRELASAWGASLPAGTACVQAKTQGLACWRHRAGSVPMLAQLDRPVVLALANAAGQTAHVRLVALGQGGAVLAAGTRQWVMPNTQLATLWRGGLVTLWRLPTRIDPALAQAAAGLGPGAHGAAVVALRRALARANGQADVPDADVEAYDNGLRQQVVAFQRATGVQPDGLIGPTTLMQLNKALAVDEPRLAWE